VHRHGSQRPPTFGSISSIDARRRREGGGQQAYYAWGFGGQYIVIVPAQRLVIVATSSTATGEDRRSHRQTIFELIEQMIVAPLAASANP
jgi:CubicO group peptidase (beta-lactamase class C family)